MRQTNSIVGWLSLGLAATASASAAQDSAPKPRFHADGTVMVPSFELPPSAFLSPEALALQKSRANAAEEQNAIVMETDIVASRAASEASHAHQVEEATRRYPARVVPQVIAGVKTRVITPATGEADRRRVLINLHGGAWSRCAYSCAVVESLPIASIGRYKVITIDYRQGPEFEFPAASEDVAAVFAALLKSYRPQNIGIYGCSAGGSLTAQSAAWFQAHGLPSPGALGIFGNGAMPPIKGDSVYLDRYVNGHAPAGRPPAYFKNADMKSPLVAPAFHPDVLARFPPTLILTGTRAHDLSPAAYLHGQLLKAQVRSHLLVGEGMGHCYIMEPGLPESRDAYDVIVRFFNENLGTGK